VAIEGVVAGQVFKGRRTSLRAGSASQVFSHSGTARLATKTLVSGLKAGERRTSLQNRWAGESSPAGSIPVRLRFEERCLTSDVASSRTRRLVRTAAPATVPHAPAPAAPRDCGMSIPHARCHSRDRYSRGLLASRPSLDAGAVPAPGTCDRP
jgi:hypothetical protein